MGSNGGAAATGGGYAKAISRASAPRRFAFVGGNTGADGRGVELSTVTSVRRPVAAARLARVLGVGLGLFAGACAHRPAAQPSTQVGWIDAALVGQTAGEGADLDLDEDAAPTLRVAGLDHLLDLFDAARFAEDADAREALWSALGGHPTGIGDTATRDATARLLDEALAIEEAAERTPLDEDRTRFLADAIMLLTVDLERPATAEDLSIRTLAYRQIVERGHPRIADNAHWRLYDHVRGTLQGAVEAPPERRIEIAVQALYAARDDVSEHLADAAPHAKPRWPTLDELWATLEEHRAALRSDPRWNPIVRMRAASDDALHEVLETALPAQRDPGWPAILVPAGTGKPESLAPALVVEDGRVILDAGRPQARTLPLDDIEPLVTAMQATVAQDGRGVLLVALDPALPSPQLRNVLRAVRRAQISRLELALREPRVTREGEVVTVLPLEVARSVDGGPGARALLDARVHVHLDGKGIGVAIDDRRLTAFPSEPREVADLIGKVRGAYPRERIVRLTLSDDVQPQQLVDALIALQGGRDPAFGVVGWWAGGTLPASEPAAAHDRVLEHRVALYRGAPPVLEQPFPLQAADQKRLEHFVEQVRTCLPELEAPIRPGQALRFALVFEQGRLVDVTAPHVDGPRKDRPSKAGLDALVGCIREDAFGLRLREHLDRIPMSLVLGAPR